MTDLPIFGAGIWHFATYKDRYATEGYGPRSVCSSRSTGPAPSVTSPSSTSTGRSPASTERSTTSRRR